MSCKVYHEVLPTYVNDTQSGWMCVRCRKPTARPTRYITRNWKEFGLAKNDIN